MSTTKQSYRESKKFNDWCKYFFDKKNTTTYGNATQSALKTYNTTDYSSAGVIGHKNIKKVKMLSSIVAEQQGYSYTKMIRIGLSKMEKSDDVKWWKEMMDVLGYKEQQEKIVLSHQMDIIEGLKKSCKERNLPM